MIMEYVSWRTWSDTHRTSGECQWEWRGFSRERGKKKRKEKRLKVHGISYKFMWVPYPLGFCCFWGWPIGFAFPRCFICNSYIHSTLHIWPVFHLKSKGCISQCGSVAESAHVAIEEFAGCPRYCSWIATAGVGVVLHQDKQGGSWSTQRACAQSSKLHN